MLRQPADHGDDPGQGLHLDRGYDPAKTRNLLELLGFEPTSRRRGNPHPSKAGRRWPVERTHVWLNGYGKLRRCTDNVAPQCFASATARPVNPASNLVIRRAAVRDSSATLAAQQQKLRPNLGTSRGGGAGPARRRRRRRCARGSRASGAAL